MVCFALLLALSTYQKVIERLEGGSVGGRVGGSYAFHLSYPNGLHTDRCSYSQGRASPEYMQPSVFVVPYHQPGYGLVRPSQPLAIHLLALSSTQRDGRSCGFSCPTLLLSFIPDRCLIPHRIFGLLINHKRGAVDRETQLVD